MNFKNKLISILATIFILFNTTSFSGTDSTTTNSLNIYSPSCILMDATTGTILYEKNAEKVMYPASTTKLMTAILVLENCNLTDIATVSMTATHLVPRSYSIADLEIGEKLTIEQLLNVLLIPSANDAANVLAEHVAGSVENFAQMMNDKALSIGCKNTHFVNPNGVHNENHCSTAYDLALIGQYALKFEVIKEIVMKPNYSLPDRVTDSHNILRQFKNTNELIKDSGKYYYEYANGLKTGYTNAAKSCIVASSKKGDFELICVVLSGEKTETFQNMRELDCMSLFEYGFNDCCLEQIYDEYNKKLADEKKLSIYKLEKTVNATLSDTKNILTIIFYISLCLFLFYVLIKFNKRKNKKKKKKKKKKSKKDNIYRFKLF